MLSVSNTISLRARGAITQNWADGSMVTHTHTHKINRKTQQEHQINILPPLSLQVGHNKARQMTRVATATKSLRYYTARQV